MAETLEGAVARVVFRTPDGVFAVLRLQVAGHDAPVTVVGPFGDATPGETLKLHGAWENHPAHGPQFRAMEVAVELPRTAEGVGRYLEGIEGIGPSLAGRLVAAFGAAAIDVLEKEPWRAAQIKGVGKRRAEKAGKNASARREDREVMVFLQGLGVSLAYARRIRKVYGQQAMAKIRHNPYRLARDIAGIGFQVADRIARGLGIAATSPLRIQAGILHVLEAFATEGHIFAPREALLQRASQTLGTDLASAQVACDQLREEGALVEEGDALFLPRLCRSERELAARIRELLAADRRPPPPLVATGPLSDAQRRAVIACMGSGVAVITGGPGTGKTTIVRSLVASWRKAARGVLLAAPTGRAAKRLADATGHEAQTVHRLLEWGQPNKSGGGRTFGRGPDNLLGADLIVVDESSMLDVLLACGLFSAIPLGATVILVGDVDQLPSVGPGQVLADIIKSGRVPVGRLSEVFRQAEGSGIIENAYRILSGELPVSAPRAESPRDFYIVNAEEPERARDLVVRVCQERIPQAFGLDPIEDIQVLTPMQRGPAGTEGLNRALQAALNPNGDALRLGERLLKTGDKVMQVRNDYDREVFNGDIGTVRSIHPPSGESTKPALEVEFDGRRVRYEGEALDQLELAYAVSVHKSQGSEYPAVVLPLLMQHYLLLQRNLLYTAVTRGKRLVVVVGSERAIRRAVESSGVEFRHSRLAARLRESVDGKLGR